MQLYKILNACSWVNFHRVLCMFIFYREHFEIAKICGFLNKNHYIPIIFFYLIKYK